MSKRDLKKYLKELDKEQLEEQVLDLYERFKEVKAFYNFAFNPKEDLLMEEARFKISKEYFPLTRRRAKLRRSVAQNLIKQFKTLEVDSHLIADLMLYNIEIAQSYSDGREMKQVSFYKSMLTSFEEAYDFIRSTGISIDFEKRMETIVLETKKQEWLNSPAFETILNKGFKN